mmetsp:Transcript_53434/g.84973  ORF Transcript_53434/g.84973 Transcript_53434/m.84973 type:complete len:188 (-) Transcript_53434:34-597(-)
MSNLKWGFDKEYGHRVLPSRWQSSGFTFYNADPLRKTNFHEPFLPVLRENVSPSVPVYNDERPQDSIAPMSAYGSHRPMLWSTSLRSPRNPYPGSPTREQSYLQEPSPSRHWRASKSLALSARSIASSYGQSGGQYSREVSEAQSAHAKRLKEWVAEWERTSAECRGAHAQAVAGLLTQDGLHDTDL